LLYYLGFRMRAWCLKFMKLPEKSSNLNSVRSN
jgi:hypothetical protein